MTISIDNVLSAVRAGARVSINDRRSRQEGVLVSLKVGDLTVPVPMSDEDAVALLESVTEER
jgi:hypothetical protein